MNATALLGQLPADAYGFVLLLARFGALIMIAPGVGETQMPVMLRAALATSVAVLLLPVLAAGLPPVPDHPMRVAAALAAELLTGIWFGWLARLVALALPMAAQIISYLTGLSSVIAVDFSSGGGQASILSRFFALVPVVLLLASGLYAEPLTALAASYKVIPPGFALPSADAVPMVVRAVGESFALAVRLAAPFLVAGSVWQIGLGVLARLVPALQVYQLAMPGQVLGGLVLLAVSLPLMLGAWAAAAPAMLVPLTGG